MTVPRVEVVAIPRVNVLGVGVSAIDPPMALATIEDWIQRRDAHYVTITGVHGVMESQADPEIRSIHNRAGLVTPDGMPLVWASRIAGWCWRSRGKRPLNWPGGFSPKPARKRTTS